MYAFDCPATVDMLIKHVGTLIGFKYLNINWVLGRIEPGLSIKTLFLSSKDRFQEQLDVEDSNDILYTSIGMSVMGAIGFLLLILAMSRFEKGKELAKNLI